MKIIKKIFAFSAVSVLMFVFSFNAFGEGPDTNSVADYGEEIYSTLDSDTREILSSFGIDSLDFDSVFDISFSSSIKTIGEIFKSSIKDILPAFFKILAMLMIMTAISDLRKSSSSENDIVSSIFTMAIIIMTASFISDILTQTTAAFNLTGKLLLTLAPIITALLSVSGNVTVSVLYNSVTVAAAQIISVISSEILIPLIGIYFALVISLDLNDTNKGSKIIHGMNKALTGIFAAMSTVFTFILSVKNVLAKELDGVLYKSGKYVIASIVPVVGSNISAILSSVIGSLDLIKSTVAVFGVICITAISVPVILKLFACYISLNVLSMVSDFFSSSAASSVIRGFAGGIKLLIAIILFELVIVIISIGLTVTIKGSV